MLFGVNCMRTSWPAQGPSCVANIGTRRSTVAKEGISYTGALHLVATLSSRLVYSVPVIMHLHVPISTLLREERCNWPCLRCWATPSHRRCPGTHVASCNTSGTARVTLGSQVLTLSVAFVTILSSDYAVITINARPISL